MSRSFRGVPVSPGVAIGKASILTAAPHGVTPPRPEGATHEAERSRVEAAIVRATRSGSFAPVSRNRSGRGRPRSSTRRSSSSTIPR